MQNYSLTVNKFVEHAAKWFEQQTIVSAHQGQSQRRASYASLQERSNLLSGALQHLGLKMGDRVGTLAWNSLHHLEMYYATMGIGLICHTMNPRFSTDHLATIINEAKNKVIAVSYDLLPLLAEIVPSCSSIEHIIIMDLHDRALPDHQSLPLSVWDQNALIEHHGHLVEWGEFSEDHPAGLCYTSGTTGKPKGVLYSHRSNYLHTLRSLQADAFALRSSDTVLVAVPMFHANGWGLPFSAAAVGANIVLPGRHTDGESLARLMLNEKVTVAAGVQTVWLSLIDYLDQHGGELPDLQRIIIGGSKCPEALINRIENRLGIKVQTSWGMTELSPLGTIAPPHCTSEQQKTAGQPVMGLDLKLTDAEGVPLATQRNTIGHLKVKGASVIERYYLAEQSALDPQGYFDTGDLAVIDEHGNLTICGRAKDLIKSGGEWINPAEIEEIIGQHPSVGLVAVIGRADAKWGERPIIVVELRPGEDIKEEMFKQYLKGKIPDWWIPNETFQVSSMPVAATGKIDKNQLRNQFSESLTDSS